MQDPSLQAATASEPLSLKEEYEMCRRWREDSDKLTFVICLPIQREQTSIKAEVDDAPQRMVGDINLFLFTPDSDSDGGEAEGGVVGEIELMIARVELRRKGLGRVALLAFLKYVLEKWRAIGDQYLGKGSEIELQFLRVKVSETNVGSFRLFESVGFEKIGECANYFGEIEMRWKPDLEALKALNGPQGLMEMDYVLDGG